MPSRKAGKKKNESHHIQTLWLIAIVAGIAWLAISQLRAAPQTPNERFIASEPASNP